MSARRFFLRLRSFFRSGRADAELAREINAHVQLLEDRYVSEGMSADEARYAARRAFGGQLEQTKLRHRDARSFRMLDDWWLDLKLGVRMARKYPGLTFIAVFALAVAIGSGAAYLEFANSLVRPTLPIPEGHRLVGIRLRDVAANSVERRSLHDYLLWRGRVRTIEHFGAGRTFERNLITGDGRAAPAKGVELTASAFTLIPTPPLLGRTLVADDERAGAPDVLLIGHSLWQSRFGGDNDIVGRTVRLGGKLHTIVGVMPEGFGFPINHSLWVPFRIPQGDVARGQGPSISMFGRLAPSADLEAAQAELAALSANANPRSSDPQLKPDVRFFIDAIWTADFEAQLQRIILLGANLVFLVLLGVCGANVGTLVFARTVMREGEITVRTALGASRSRIVAQLFMEALVLSTLGAALGLAGAQYAFQWGQSTFQTAAADGAPVPFWWKDQLSLETCIYAGVLAILGALLVGVVPALKATGRQMQSGLKHAAAGGAGLKFGGIWTAIIVAQVGLTVVFLMSVILVGWEMTTHEYSGGEVSFQREQFISARLDVDAEDTALGGQAPTDARSPARMTRIHDELARRLGAEPGVRSVTFGSSFPGRGHREFVLEFDSATVGGTPLPAASADGLLWVRAVSISADYFDTFGARIAAGRPFSPGEVRTDRAVAIVDATFVSQVLGGRNPIGVRLRERPESTEQSAPRWYEIVGVVEDLSRYPTESAHDAVLYLPGVPGVSPLSLIARVEGDTNPVRSRIPVIAGEIDPTLKVRELMRLDEVNDADQLASSFFAKALAIVGGVTLLLATAGVYSLLAFAVARRTREIGIRTALGADRRQILSSLFARTFRQVLLGIALGSIPGGFLLAATAPAAGRGSLGLVAGVALVSVGSFILLITSIACVVPARRALRVHPLEALRAE